MFADGTPYLRTFNLLLKVLSRHLSTLFQSLGKISLHTTRRPNPGQQLKAILLLLLSHLLLVSTTICRLMVVQTDMACSVYVGTPRIIHMPSGLCQIQRKILTLALAHSHTLSSLPLVPFVRLGMSSSFTTYGSTDPQTLDTIMWNNYATSTSSFHRPSYAGDFSLVSSGGHL